MGFLLSEPHCALHFPENQNGFYSEQEGLQLTNESVQPSFKDPWIEFDTDTWGANTQNLFYNQANTTQAAVLHIYQHFC